MSRHLIADNDTCGEVSLDGRYICVKRKGHTGQHGDGKWPQRYAQTSPANPLPVTVTEHADPHPAQLRSIAQGLDDYAFQPVWAKELREAATAYEQARADIARLEAENALLRRSLTMVCKEQS